MKYSLEISTAVLISILLLFVQIQVPRPMLMAERFWEGAGYIQILVTALYGAYIAHMMKDPKRVPVWRLRIWKLFSFVFFAQLILGLIGFEIFLMSGKLHFPIPALIVSGPLYRGEITFMIVLFVSTVLLSGPAWCSYFCYFGAIDGAASQGKKTDVITHLWRYKFSGLILVFGITLVLRIFQTPIDLAIILASGFGIGGLIITLFVSRKKKMMVHCTTYCPIGTIVSGIKYVSPFRMKINADCSQCMRCVSSCKYQALTPIDIKNLQPGHTCTYCGDCLQSCHSSSIYYSLWKLQPETARALFLCITISLHASCLVLARI